MAERKYRYNGEYAVKYDSPIASNMESVELFDCLNWKFVDTSKYSLDQIVDIVSEVWGTWREITEEEYNEVIKKEE